MTFFEIFRVVLANRRPKWGSYYSVMCQSLTAYREVVAHERHEHLRRISDDFGCGAILRYGEDRWGSPK